MLIEIPKTNYPGIYALVNLENGKCYVGKTSNLRKRISQHLSQLKAGKHQNRAMQEDYNTGYIFKSVILEEFKEDIESRDLYKAENFYITLYKSIEEEHGYNSYKQTAHLPYDSIRKMIAWQTVEEILEDVKKKVNREVEKAFEEIIIRNYLN